MLNGHPGVAESAVIGVRVGEGLMGERVEAFVVKSAGSEVDEAALQAFARDKLADFKVPCRIVIVAGIPKGATGRMRRIGLAEKLGLAGPVEA